MIGVQIDRLNRHYGAVPVLHDITMEIEPGEFTVLLGPSGCGKSTLLATIAGLDDMQGGSIRFDGDDVTDLDAADRNIGMVFQSYALYPTMTVRGNLSFALEVARTPRREIAERVGWVAQLLQLSPFLDRKPSELSGGQRQRVAIGRALVRKTNLFLFDEPLSNLDAKLRTEMRVEIKALHKRLGATFVYVTHDQVEAMTLATRIAIMRGGRIEQYAAPAEVYERPASVFVADFIGAPPMNLLPAAMRPAREGWAAHVEGSAAVPIPDYPFRHPPAEGDRVLVGIRPENIALGAPDAVTSLRGEVLVVEPLGSDTLVWVEIAGRRLAVRTSPQAAPGVDAAVSLSFAPEHVSVFSEDTGLRL